MGSTFGKVRKYNLNPVDDSATPLRYSSVPEGQMGPPADPPLSKPSLNDNDTIQNTVPEGKHPSMKIPVEPFHETSPNYSQLLPDHLRTSIDGIYIPRTTSSVGRHFSTKSFEMPHSATSTLKGPPVPDRNSPGVNTTGKTKDFDPQQRLKPRQKYYSAEDINKIIMQLRSRNNTKDDIKREPSTLHYSTTGPLQINHDEPCKFCRGFNGLEHRGQYILEPGPPQYRTTSVTGGLPLVHNPTGKHYHLIEVNPAPRYFTGNQSGLNSRHRYNVLKDTSRPNLMEPSPSYGTNVTQNTDNSVTETNREGSQEPRPKNNSPSNSKGTLFHNEHRPVTRNSDSSRLNHDTSYRSGVLGQPLTHDYNTRSLPFRGATHHCYTIPEENVTLSSPFHHSHSFR